MIQYIFTVITSNSSNVICNTVLFCCSLLAVLIQNKITKKIPVHLLFRLCSQWPAKRGGGGGRMKRQWWGRDVWSGRGGSKGRGGGLKEERRQQGGGERGYGSCA